MFSSKPCPGIVFRGVPLYQSTSNSHTLQNWEYPVGDISHWTETIFIFIKKNDSRPLSKHCRIYWTYIQFLSEYFKTKYVSGRASEIRKGMSPTQGEDIV